MSCVFFSGVETGDVSEFPSITGTTAAVTSPLISGAYSAKLTTPSGALTSTFGLNLPTYAVRMRFQIHITSNPGSNLNFALMAAQDGAFNAISYIGITITTGGAITIWCHQVNGTPIDVGPITTSISADTNYLVELKTVVSSSNGSTEWKLDGASKGRLQGNTGTVNADSAYININMATGSVFVIFDDFYIDNAEFPGPGVCIARQGKAGAPTYDAFTKTGAATAALCWSDTPFSAATNCNSSTSAAAQTMLTTSFASKSSTHGNEHLWSGTGGLTINACKTAMIAKTASGSSHSIRRRLAAADTDTAKTLTTSDAYYDDGIWTDTLANLNAAEIGMLHGANVNLTTVEDMWLMMDFDRQFILSK